MLFGPKYDRYAERFLVAAPQAMRLPRRIPPKISAFIP